MKKVVSVVSAFLVICSSIVAISLPASKNADLLKANVEALSEDEGMEEEFDCWDTVTTATAQSCFYCGTCSSISGKPSLWSSLSKCRPGM